MVPPIPTFRIYPDLTCQLDSDHSPASYIFALAVMLRLPEKQHLSTLEAIQHPGGADDGKIPKKVVLSLT